MPHQHSLVDLGFSEPACLVRISLHGDDNHDTDDDYDDNYDDDDHNNDDDDDDVVHLLRGEKGLDSNLLSSPAGQPYFPISEIIMIINRDDYDYPTCYTSDDDSNNNDDHDHDDNKEDDQLFRCSVLMFVSILPALTNPPLHLDLQR